MHRRADQAGRDLDDLWSGRGRRPGRAVPGSTPAAGA
jgi:hypothetical protein